MCALVVLNESLQKDEKIQALGHCDVTTEPSDEEPATYIHICSTLVLYGKILYFVLKLTYHHLFVGSTWLCGNQFPSDH